MGKNKRQSEIDDNGDDTPSKRARQDVQMNSYGRVDPTFGQRSAIPGLDDYSMQIDDTELDYGDNDGALTYLRTVRLEAATIPTLLVAAKKPSLNQEDLDRSIYEDGLGDTRGFYEDGAYTARPIESANSSSEVDTEEYRSRDPQIVYFDKIIERYKALREKIAQIPPRHALERLDSNHTYYMTSSTKGYKMWRWRLISTDPEAAQLASMPKDTVLKLLKMLSENRFLKQEGIKLRTSRWIWGLLAKMPVRGELNSEEIGVVRELGKRAVWVGMGLKGVNMEVLEEPNLEEEDEAVDIEYNNAEDEDKRPENNRGPLIGPVMPNGNNNLVEETEIGELNESNDEERIHRTEDFATAKKRLLARLVDTGDNESEPGIAENDVVEDSPVMADAGTAIHELVNTRAIIDTIITIIAEMYGQLDLLEFREVWE